MKSEQEMRSYVMRRVYGLYILRQVARPAVRLTILACAFFGIAVSVSLSSVFQNLVNTGDTLAFLRLAIDAFVKTDFMVQLSATLVAGILGWLIADSLRGLMHNSAT